MGENDATKGPLPDPGWYRQGDLLRWWDGAEWSDATRPLPAAAAAVARPAQRSQGRRVLAFIGVAALAFLIGVAVGTVGDAEGETAARPTPPTPSPTPSPTVATTSTPTEPPQIARLKSSLAAQEKELDKRETALDSQASKLEQRAAKLKTRLAKVKAREEAVESAEDDQESAEPDSGMDPIFDTCGEANDNGYGPYSSDEPEYPHYDDRDNDGLVCET